MDELIAQLKRVADALEAQDRFNQEWMEFNQEIQARHKHYREVDLDRIHEQQTKDEIHNKAIEDRRIQESEAAKQAIQARIAALDANEISVIAQHIFTEVFPQGETEDTNG